MMQEMKSLDLYEKLVIFWKGFTYGRGISGLMCILVQFLWDLDKRIGILKTEELLFKDCFECFT